MTHRGPRLARLDPARYGHRMALSDTYVRFDGEITQASGNRAELKRIRRRIRRADLDDQERAGLLERARFVPGCFPPEVELADEPPALARA